MGLVKCHDCSEWKEDCTCTEEKYYLAIYYNTDGWSLRECDSLEEIKEVILNGETYGNKFKVFKEMNLTIQITE